MRGSLEGMQHLAHSAVVRGSCLPLQLSPRRPPPHSPPSETSETGNRPNLLEALGPPRVAMAARVSSAAPDVVSSTTPLTRPARPVDAAELIEQASAFGGDEWPNSHAVEHSAFASTAFNTKLASAALDTLHGSRAASDLEAPQISSQDPSPLRRGGPVAFWPGEPPASVTGGRSSPERLCLNNVGDLALRGGASLRGSVPLDVRRVSRSSSVSSYCALESRPMGWLLPSGTHHERLQRLREKYAVTDEPEGR